VRGFKKNRGSMYFFLDYFLDGYNTQLKFYCIENQDRMSLLLRQRSKSQFFIRPNTYHEFHGVNSSQLSVPDKIKLVAKRIEELRKRGYPEEWIQRDLERLTEGL
jgi:hypothetical protein